jgi:alpha-glucoside transport system permease protein
MDQGQAAITPPTSSSVTAMPSAVTIAPRRRRGQAGNYLTALLFVGPALVLIGFFIVYPAIRTIIDSFYETIGIGVNAPQKFVGLDNYNNFLTDPAIQTAIKNNILWIVVVTPVTVALGVVFAVLFDRVRYEAVAKSIVFIPMAISATAAGVIWKLTYADDANIGTINAVLGWFHAGPIAFLGSAHWANVALFGAQIWMSMGFAVVVLSAALKAIPTELNEAARLDGANNWQIFRQLTVPLMWPTITVIATLTMIGVIKIFDIVIVLTGGGPAGSTDVLATLMYNQAFQSNNPGYAAAIAVVLLIAVIPVMALNIRRFKTESAR